jgi:small subunit ribosomal protein S7
MPRRRKVTKRERSSDPVYKSKLVTQFINCLMKGGKKSVSEAVFYGSLDIIQKKGGKDPWEVFKKAVDNVKPVLEVKPRRVGGATYQVPLQVRPERRVSLAIRWLIQFARQRKGKPMREKLALEFLDAAGNTGAAIKKKEDTRKMAEANKAFAHYRW